VEAEADADHHTEDAARADRDPCDPLVAPGRRSGLERAAVSPRRGAGGPVRRAGRGSSAPACHASCFGGLAGFLGAARFLGLAVLGGPAVLLRAPLRGLAFLLGLARFLGLARLDLGDLIARSTGQRAVRRLGQITLYRVSATSIRPASRCASAMLKTSVGCGTSE
jgi:hypothetical protein